MREFAVKLHDQQDGQGVDWRLLAETLFRASFDVLDRLPVDQCKAVALRVHEGSYACATREAGENSGGEPEPVGPGPTLPNARELRTPALRPPRGRY